MFPCRSEGWTSIEVPSKSDMAALLLLIHILPRFYVRSVPPLLCSNRTNSLFFSLVCMSSVPGVDIFVTPYETLRRGNSTAKTCSKAVVRRFVMQNLILPDAVYLEEDDADCEIRPKVHTTPPVWVQERPIIKISQKFF